MGKLEKDRKEKKNEEKGSVRRDEGEEEESKRSN